MGAEVVGRVAREAEMMKRSEQAYALFNFPDNGNSYLRDAGARAICAVATMVMRSMKKHQRSRRNRR